jgi:hypothetical protein
MRIGEPQSRWWREKPPVPAGTRTPEHTARRRIRRALKVFFGRVKAADELNWLYNKKKMYTLMTNPRNKILVGRDSNQRSSKHGAEVLSTTSRRSSIIHFSLLLSVWLIEVTLRGSIFREYVLSPWKWLQLLTRHVPLQPFAMRHIIPFKS